VRRALAAAALALAAVLAGCTGAEDADGDPDRVTVETADTDMTACTEQPDEAAVDGDLDGISLPCFSGGSLDLGRAQGAPTVLNLWASWCGPCREELPLMQELSDLAGDRVRVLGVISQDGVPQSVSFAVDSGITMPGAFDGDGAVAAALGLRGLPHTVFLAADGSVAFVQYGPVHSIEELTGLVAEHLGVQL
jgi:thiol-disulfide isomerase/thioredoxin